MLHIVLEIPSQCQWGTSLGSSKNDVMELRRNSYKILLCKKHGKASIKVSTKIRDVIYKRTLCHFKIIPWTLINPNYMVQFFVPF